MAQAYFDYRRIKKENPNDTVPELINKLVQTLKKYEINRAQRRTNESLLCESAMQIDIDWPEPDIFWDDECIIRCLCVALLLPIAEEDTRLDWTNLFDRKKIQRLVDHDNRDCINMRVIINSTLEAHGRNTVCVNYLCMHSNGSEWCGLKSMNFKFGDTGITKHKCVCTNEVISRGFNEKMKKKGTKCECTNIPCTIYVSKRTANEIKKGEYTQRQIRRAVTIMAFNNFFRTKQKMDEILRMYDDKFQEIKNENWLVQKEVIKSDIKEIEGMDIGVMNDDELVQKIWEILMKKQE